MLEKLLLLGCIVVRTYQFCPQSCLCNNQLLTVFCTTNFNNNHGYLNEIPNLLNPQIQTLNVQGNQIRDLSQSLQFYTQLRQLDLSYNKLENLGSLNFNELKFLTLLNISFNQIQSLNELSLRGLYSLLRLDLSGNVLDTLDHRVFQDLGQVSFLDLSQNRLEYVDWSILQGLDNLQVLVLNHNYIKTIERLFSRDEYWTLDNLLEAHLNHNQLSSLEEYHFDTFVNLQTLHLCCNKLHKVSENTFSNNVRLVTLNLSQNRLSSLPQQFLSKLTELKSLDLSFNQLTHISTHYFHSLFKMEFLDLSSNPITMVDGGALLDNINLVHFKGDNLRHLSNVSIDLLVNKPFLNVFSLKYDNLSSIDFKTHLDLIFKMDLTGNPWNCNCSLLKMYHFIINSNQSSTPVKSLVCSSPAKLQGVPFHSLLPSDFEDCYSTYDNFTQTVFIISGIIVTLIVTLICGKVIVGMIKLRRRDRSSMESFKSHHHHHHHPHHPHHNHNQPSTQQQPFHPDNTTLLHHHPHHQHPPPHLPHYNHHHHLSHHNPRSNEDLFLPRNSSTLTTQYTHVYDKQVPSVLV